MMSTAESGMEPPPGAPTGAGAQAEMITKKLANYWCVIGSIPLVMFLLVAIPTIFYVKKFSEYVNADYCDTKSCKELADVILKMGDTSEACKSFSAHVCKAKADYAIETLNKIHADITGFTAEENPGLKTANLAKSFIGACEGAGTADDGPVSALPDEMGSQLDVTGVHDPAQIAGTMAKYGLDGIVRAVQVAGNKSGNEETAQMMELSAPIEDMYVHTILEMYGVKMKDFIDKHKGDEDLDVPNLEKFLASYEAYTVASTSKTLQHMARLVTVSDLKNQHSQGNWSWATFFSAFDDLGLSYLSDDSYVKLVHPKYLLGLNAFFDEWYNKVQAHVRIFANCMMQTMALVQTLGPHLFPKGPQKKAACVMHCARLFPAAMDHMLFYTRSTQFGAANGINPGGTNSTAMMAFLSNHVQGMLDSMAFSFSLSTSVTEENRVNFYRKLKSIKVSPGFLNNTEGLDDKDIAELSAMVTPGDNFDVVGCATQVIQHFPNLYWKNNATYLKFRNPYSPLYATYTPGEQHLYVPMGVFTKPIFRNSQKNRIFAAASGFLVMSGVMKALSMSGAMVVPGQLMPENWIGYSWSRTMQKYIYCLAQDRTVNDTLITIMDEHLLGAMMPAYRYFKRMVLAKAFPRPEFRIDWVSDLSSTQLFFYNWALLHCSTPSGKLLIDLNVKNSHYFREAFHCEVGSAMYKSSRPLCELWNSTRRQY